MRSIFWGFLLAGLFFPAFLSLADDEGVESGPWQRALGPWTWLFPRDHGAHPGFKSEWWYFTGNLIDGRHRAFGYQLTLFRQGVQFTPAQSHSQWALRDITFGHFTISDLAAQKFHFEERIDRGALDGAHAAEGKMDVALGPWSIAADAGVERYHLVATEPDLALDLEAKPLKPLILEGVNGFSRKAEGEGLASYYYSYPRLETAGSLRIGTVQYQVTGQSWFDHEFSTSSIGKNQLGWDWFCIQLDNQEEIMLYAMRDRSGAIDPVSEGTWIGRDGHSVRLPPGSFAMETLATWHSATSGATYPAQWHITIPSHRADLTVTPAMADQELNLSRLGKLSYWEGACATQGLVAGQPVRGLGYTELTGYAGSLQGGLGK